MTQALIAVTRQRLASLTPTMAIPQPNASTVKQGTTYTTKTVTHQDLSIIIDEVQSLVEETSEKFVPQPTRDEILSDTINGLRRFKDAVRWKEFHRIKQQEKIKNNNKEPDQQEIEIEIFNAQTNDLNEGLGTGLRPTKINLTAPKGSDELENFLKNVEEELLNQAFRYNEKEATTPRSRAIRSLQQELKKTTNAAVIPTDKTNFSE